MYNHETKVFVYVVNACKLIVTNFKSPRKFPLLLAYRITLRVSSKQLAMPNYVHSDKVYGILYTYLHIMLDALDYHQLAYSCNSTKTVAMVKVHI